MTIDHSRSYKDLKKKIGELQSKIPEVMKSFDMLHKNCIEDGALSSKTKELIALGIAITVRCDGCISFHVQETLNAGATPQEIAETIGVAVLMGGGPAVVYGSEALEALEQFMVWKKMKLDPIKD